MKKTLKIEFTAEYDYMGLDQQTCLQVIQEIQGRLAERAGFKGITGLKYNYFEDKECEDKR